MPDETSGVGMERKLAAIFSSDVAGYSRLMGDDEEATIRTLTEYRAVISSLIQSELGKDAEAKAAAAEVLRLNPNFSLAVHKERVPIKDPSRLEHLLAALRKAGLE